MKAKLTSLLLLAATPAFAHTNGLPHVHTGDQVSVLPIVAAVTTVAVAAFFVFKIRSSQKTEKAMRPERISK